MLYPSRQIGPNYVYMGQTACPNLSGSLEYSAALRRAGWKECSIPSVCHSAPNLRNTCRDLGKAGGSCPERAVAVVISRLRSLTSGQNVKWPYSSLARRDYEMGFAQQCGLVGSVQICVVGDGVQGKGSPSPASAIQKPGSVGFRLLFCSDNAAHPVRMVADEVFCRLPTMGAVRGVLRLRV